MRHSIHLAGPRYQLRPIELADAALIIELRADTDRAHFLHPIDLTVPAQEAHLQRYFERGGDYYFVIDRRDGGEPRAEGLIGLYNIAEQARAAEVGRWVLRPGSPAAAESIWLAYRVAFEILDLQEVYCRTLVENTKALSFQDSCGLRRRAFLPGFVEWQGQRQDGVEHVLTRTRWPVVQERLTRLLNAAA
jgi:RimJ/RimL family protein N-acetyltransferase